MLMLKRKIHPPSSSSATKHFRCARRGLEASVIAVTEEARAGTSGNDAGDQEGFATGCRTAFHYGSSRASCRPDPNSGDSAPSTADFAGTRFSSSGAGAAAIEADATPGCSPSQASEAQASPKKGLLQHCRGAH